MIDFGHPELLLLLPCAAILGIIGWQRRRFAFRFSDFRLFRGLPSGRRAVWVKWTGAIGRAVIIFLLILAAANPRSPDHRTRIPTKGIAIVLALDISGSMATPDFGWEGEAVSRLDAAKSSFRLFVAGGTTISGYQFPGRLTDQIGLITFAAIPRTACPLTLNHSVLLSVLNAQQPRTGIDAGTNMGDAIAEGVIRLNAAGSERAKVLLVLSDGEHNVGSRPDGPLSPRQAAQLAANLRIPIYTIDCGGTPTGDSGAQRQAGREILMDVARMTGGRFFAADHAMELEHVYREIDTLHRETILSFRYRRYHEYGPWCGYAAVSLLLLLCVLERTIGRRFPAIA
ncbi:MAG: VWA domain-containing protein [Bacteroidales bacterium]|nr:VWA domain-containing protein [Bacteroidales bacterium]